MEKFNKKYIYKYIAFMIIGCFIGGSITWALFYFGDQVGDDFGAHESMSERDTRGKYRFIQPLLECENTSASASRKYIPFEKVTKAEILSYQEKLHPGTHLSFYFRDLNNGPWFSNNYQEGFQPASLLKIPTLIAYVKWAETDPAIMQQKIKIEPLIEYTQNIKPERVAEVGKEYSVEELLEYMVLYSDNNASNNLLIHLPAELSEDVFSTFQVPSPRDKTADTYLLNVKEYASFFRILYNASYLSKDSSEAVLNLLSKVTFSRGITGKLPKDIVVAHKFGERMYQETLPNGGSHEKAQLHDCGIVYYPGDPYLLCIMTRGDDMKELSEMTQDISKMIYDAVDTAHKKAIK